MNGNSPTPKNQKLGNVQGILVNLKEEVADLQAAVQDHGSTYFSQYAEDFDYMFDGTTDLRSPLHALGQALAAKDGESIPDYVVKPGEAFSGAGTARKDYGKLLSDVGNNVTDCKAAYHEMSLAAKDLVNDADKMDIV